MPQLAKKDNCTGCTACMAVCPKKAITMQADEYGFKYPYVNEDCINCRLCESICPVLKPIKSNEVETKGYAAFATDDAIRMDSTSGGVFSLFAMKILAEDGTVYGACYDEDFCVKHIAVNDEKDIAHLRQSKYSQSDLGDVFREIIGKLESGKKVLFSGTPCQVYGLKAAVSAKNTPYNNLLDKLLLVDFVCHSVPSPKVWDEYIKYRSKNDANGEKQTGINLRSKETGWSNYSYAVRFEYPNGVKHIDHRENDLFLKLFLGDYICRKSCASCTFKGHGRVSDITLADFWGIWDSHPEMDDNKGTSAILVHSEMGRKLIKEIESQIKKLEVSPEEISKNNPAVLKASVSSLDREKVLKLACDGRFEKIEKLLGKGPSVITKIKRRVSR